MSRADDAEFETHIRRIWQCHKNTTVLTQALGPDPVAFAQAVVQAWEEYKLGNAPTSETHQVNDSIDSEFV